jgi:hypothetical protein
LTWQSDTFAFAESYDEAANRYRGLRGGRAITLAPDDGGLIVRAAVARRQLDTETSQPSAIADCVATREATSFEEPTRRGATADAGAKPNAPRRFHGTVRLDAARVGRDAGRIAEEVIAHLAGQPGAEVSVTLEVEARLPNGASEQSIRTVTENSRTLKFINHGFEVD